MWNLVLGLHTATEEAGKFGTVTGQLCVQGEMEFSIQREGEKTLQDHVSFCLKKEKGSYRWTIKSGFRSVHVQMCKP